MLFRDVIELLDVEESVNENGFPSSNSENRTSVFANKKSVRSNEFYLAAQSGFAVELMFEVREIEYAAQKFLEYESKRYQIVRTYKKGELIELICQIYEDTP